jgi:hypothetical protein
VTKVVGMLYVFIAPLQQEVAVDIKLRIIHLKINFEAFNSPALQI